MKKINRILSLFLAAVLVLGMIPAPAQAVQEPTGPRSVVQVNPHYAHLYTEEDIRALLPEWTPDTIRPQAATYLDLESAAQVLRDGMTNRNGIIEVYWYSTEDNWAGDCYALIDLAMSHTGQPKEGDSLQWVYAGWGVDSGYSTFRDGVYQCSAAFRMYYYTNAEQERELDRAVEELLESLDLEGKTDYEKIRGVYDYICANITYDYEHLNDPSYDLMFTAYAALVNKTAVCQGYAVLLYRLLLELGVDCRVISGDGGGPHAWNIVELDGLYYNADSTWDAGYPSYYWYYFLQNFWGFLDHERDMEYDTIAFHNEYPMAAERYQSGVKAEMDPYIYVGAANGDATVLWYINRNGTLEIEGTGATYDYSEEQIPYYYYWVDELTGLWVKEGITGLGTGSFTDFYALNTIRFTGDAPAIASNAFTGVTATAYYPGDNATWTADKLKNYGGSITWVAEGAPHTHSYTGVITAPTCTEQGYTTYTCECGESYVSDYTDALGHALGEWYTVKEATCTESGSERRDCARCDHHETRATAKLDHSYTPAVTAPTCTEQGYTTYTCSCGESYTADFVDALGHDWDGGIVTVEPTEDMPGEKLYTCKRCRDTRTEVLPELDHTHSYTPTVTAPTCTEQGYTTYTCDCGDSYVADYTDALGHDMGEWYTVKEATCAEEGTERRDCARCDHHETRATEKLAHSYNAEVTDPTCTEQGYTTYTCVCGDSYIADYVDALGHDLGAWKTMEVPSQTEDGFERRVCARCDYLEERAIACKDETHDAYFCPEEWEVLKLTNKARHAEGLRPLTGFALLQDVAQLRAEELTEHFAHKRPDGSDCWTAYDEVGVVWTYAAENIGAGYNNAAHAVTGWMNSPAHRENIMCERLDSLGVGYYYDDSNYYKRFWTQNFRSMTGEFTDYRIVMPNGGYFPVGTDFDEMDIYLVLEHSEDDYEHYLPLTEELLSGMTVKDSVMTVTFDLLGLSGSFEIIYVNPFTDVPESEYYYEPVLWAVEKGITNGTSPTRFSPDKECTRAQVVTFLWRAAGCPEPQTTSHSFTDLKPGEYYEKAVLWAVENGITNGTSPTTFRPDKTCTRGQIVTFLWRAAGCPEPESDSHPFTDMKPGEYYEKAVLWAVENEITNGTSPTTFRPDKTCTRGQVVTFLFRAEQNAK